MIQTLLQELGFTEKEADVYLTILQQGKINHADLSKLTNINRTTVYAIVKELIKHGVVYEDIGSNTTYVLARPPQQLRIIVDKEKAHIYQKEKIVSEAVKELERITKDTRYSIPKMVFIDEDRLRHYTRSRWKTWNDSIMSRDGSWWGFQDHTWVEHFAEEIAWFWKKVADPNLQLRLLTNHAQVEVGMGKKYPRRHMKFWPYSQHFTGTTWVAGDYLVMVFTKQHPFYLIEIYDAVMAQNMRQLFKGIWEGVK